MADPDPPDPERDRQTRQMDPASMRSLPIAIAALERAGPAYVFALRLGTLALIQATVRELAQPDASRAGVARLRALVADLEQMPFDR